MTTQALTQGVHHVGLTVPDVARTRAFFVEVLGFDKVGERPAYPAEFVSDGSVMVTLWQAEGDARDFDRKGCVGLHHVAFQAPNLDALHTRLAATDGVTIEFPPEPLGGGATRHMMCRIPGGVRVEFIAPAS